MRALRLQSEIRETFFYKRYVGHVKLASVQIVRLLRGGIEVEKPVLLNGNALIFAKGGE